MDWANASQRHFTILREELGCNVSETESPAHQPRTNGQGRSGSRLLDSCGLERGAKLRMKKHSFRRDVEI